MANPQYQRNIRKLVIGFGNLFKNITLVRYNPDLTEQERMIVPIVYASKEDYVMRLQGDPELTKKIQMTLPRMSFQMTGMKYDQTRKQNTMFKNVVNTPTGLKSQFNPVPYDFDFSLFIYIRNIEDGNQIIEHILPYFTPDYTIKLNMVPEMGTIKEIPIVLNSVDMPADFEGGQERETRVLIWTLNFTVKGFIFGNISSTGLIEHSITNIYNKDRAGDLVSFYMDPSSGVGTYQTGELVYQGYSIGTAISSGQVHHYSAANGSNILTLVNTSGNFTNNLPIVGSITGASFEYNSFNRTPYKLVQMDVYPNPIDAQPDEPHTYTINITEVK